MLGDPMGKIPYDSFSKYWAMFLTAEIGLGVILSLVALIKMQQPLQLIGLLFFILLFMIFWYATRRVVDGSTFVKLRSSDTVPLNVLQPGRYRYKLTTELGTFQKDGCCFVFVNVPAERYNLTKDLYYFDINSARFGRDLRDLAKTCPAAAERVITWVDEYEYKFKMSNFYMQEAVEASKEVVATLK